MPVWRTLNISAVVHDYFDNYIKEDSVECHVHSVVHQIAQQACVRVIRVGAVIGGHRGIGFGAGGLGVGFGPAVLATVAGLAVDGREVHVLGQRGRDDSIHSLVRTIWLLDRFEPGGKHAYANRMTVQVGHPLPGDGA